MTVVAQFHAKQRQLVLEDYARAKNRWIPLSFRVGFFVESTVVILLLLIFNAYDSLSVWSVVAVSIISFEAINMVSYITALHSDELATKLRYFLVVFLFQVLATIGFVTAGGLIPSELIDRPGLSFARLVASFAIGAYLSISSTYTGTLILIPHLAPRHIRRKLYGLCAKCGHARPQNRERNCAQCGSLLDFENDEHREA